MNVEKLKELRNGRTLSQRTFAAHLGVSQATIASWESGRTEPDNTMLKQIAKYFNVSIDYLLDNDGDSGKAALNAEQAALIAEYDALNDEGRRTLQSILSSLRLTHGRSGKSSALPSYMPVNARMTAAVARN